MKKMNNSRVILSVAKNLACVSLLALAACSVYDNYSEEAFNEFYGIGVEDESSSSVEEISSSSSVKNDESSSSAKEDVSSSSAKNDESSSSTKEDASSSSVKEEASSSSEKKDTTYVVIVNPSSSSEAVSSSSVSIAERLKCGLDSLEDNRDNAVTKKYKTVKMSKQCWLAKNADFPTEEGSSCYSEGSCEEYGRLYNGDVASYACPEGTHLPTPEEFDELISAFGGAASAGDMLKSESGWAGRVVENAQGFNALPAGVIDDEGDASGRGEQTYFWADEAESIYRTAYFLRSADHLFSSELREAGYQYSVRCILDSGIWR